MCVCMCDTGRDCMVGQGDKVALVAAQGSDRNGLPIPRHGGFYISARDDDLVQWTLAPSCSLKS